MTNTLHRYGSSDSLADDYIAFVTPSKGINDQGSEPKLRAFLQAALKYRPVNLGGGSQGGIYRPSKDLNLFNLYLMKRKHAIDPKELVEASREADTVAAVFDNRQALEEFLAELRRLDLGLSVNVSALVDSTRHACQKTGICPHSVEYSLGFRGRMDRLPARRVLELSAMCGHGMVSSNYTKKMIDMVKEGRLTPEMASQYMAKFCVCGVFNVSRARRLLKEARLSD